MEDWKRKMVDAVRPYTEGDSSVAQWRREELRAWLAARDLTEVAAIGTAKNAVGLMEMIDRWHDDDVAQQPCAAPAPPANPFIVERVVRELTCGASDEITVTMENDDSVDIVIKRAFYTPTQLRNLAKQLTDLADAHEAVYPPNHCAAAC